MNIVASAITFLLLASPGVARLSSTSPASPSTRNVLLEENNDPILLGEDFATDNTQAAGGGTNLQFFSVSSSSAMESPQADAPCHLDVIDQRDVDNLDGNYSYAYTGNGVTVYVLHSSGPRLTHEDFAGRATCGYDASGLLGRLLGIQKRSNRCDRKDSNLATAMMGLVGGNTYGVAKDVKMVHVMAENGRPRSRALRWIADQKNENPDTPMVLATNYYGPSSLLGTRAAVRAMRQVIDAGVVVVAGTPYEENGACGLGRLKVWKEDFPEIITAAYTDCNATNLEFNEAIGGDLSCVDILAPGVDISAPVGRADDAYSSGGGTSTGLVAALVAGAAALYLEKDPDLTSADVLAAMVADATDGVVKGLDEGAPNKFLYTGNL